MEPKRAFRSVREGLSARQVFGEPVARDGVTVIPAATVIGAGGGAVAAKGPGEGDFVLALGMAILTTRHRS